MRKAKTAGIFPNAIEILAGGKKVRKFGHFQLLFLIDENQSELAFNFVGFLKLIIFFCILFFLDWSSFCWLNWQHFFGSFLSRDEAYRLIVEGWSQHNNDAKAIFDQQVRNFLVFL